MTMTATTSKSLTPEALGEELLSLLIGEERQMKAAIDLLLHQAVQHRASDVHVEPYQGIVRVRFRVDGYFREVAELPVDVLEQFVSRVKVMAGLIVHRRDIPQEGRIRADDADFRVSILPTVAGEKLALRAFDSAGRLMELDDLGISETTLDTLAGLLSALSGTVLLTGPSGSGKTTTIYAALKRIHDRFGDHAAITAIEDPVEFDLGLFAQVQVGRRTELTFASALTSVLRQDPRVIMLGEIRDPQTGEIAMRAGLTGHLVLSTIHSGTACGVLARLMDMGIEPYVVNSSVKAVLAQRLARRICPDCVEEYRPHSALVDLLKGWAPDFDGPFRRGAGCGHCLGTGHLGRFALTELLVLDESLARLIAQKAGTRRVEELAVSGGFRPLIADGVAAVVDGRTTVEEVVRALGTEVSS
jgi:type IV pilus assembly protein PilB